MILVDQEGKPTISSAKHELRVLYYGPIPKIDSNTKVDSFLASLRSAPLKMLFAGRAANQTANILSIPVLVLALYLIYFAVWPA
jgi:hypothetical protein